VWTIIGGIYYLIFFFITYRLFRFSGYPFWWYVALGLCVFMMVVNGLSNYVIFRARNLYLSFVIGAVFPVMDVTLFALLMALDRSACAGNDSISTLSSLCGVLGLRFMEVKSGRKSN
jgi:hypothetical protein